MKWILVATLLSGALDPGPQIPKIPDPPIIRFLNKDLWKLLALGTQCVDAQGINICAEANIRGEVLFTAKWRF